MNRTGGPVGSSRIAACALGFAACALDLAGCAAGETVRPAGTVRYVGSSTVAIFLRAAEAEYGAVRFELDTRPESEGGERAIVEGRADLAGTARVPSSETLLAGVTATLIGRDAIAVIVNARNPVTDLSRATLQGLFTGGITNWRDAGGPDLPVRPFVVGPRSATREVFRTAVLGERDYAGCEEVRPDEAILERVAGAPGAVGQISFSFLAGAAGVRPVAVDGEEPTVTNFAYPLSRPLYLLWREGAPVVEAFVDWARSEEGQRVVMRGFVGTRVVGSVDSVEPQAATGSLVVYTETFSVDDGGIFYYPHRAYEILDRRGNLIRRVRNHRGENDENPTRIDIVPGTYLIRTRTGRGETLEYFVTVEVGALTRLDVEELRRGER